MASAIVLEPEANTCGRIEVIAREIAVRETGIHLREHDTDIGVPLRQKPPIDQAGDGVERALALRVRGRIDAAGGGVGILNVMIIGADDIEVFVDRISCARPHHLHDFVTASAGPAAGRVGHVADSREVVIGAAHGETADVAKAGHGIHRIAGRRELIPFVAGIQFQGPDACIWPAT